MPPGQVLVSAREIAFPDNIETCKSAQYVLVYLIDEWVWTFSRELQLNYSRNNGARLLCVRLAQTVYKQLCRYLPYTRLCVRII